MGRLKQWFNRRILRRTGGWYSAGGNYTITVPPGKWTIGQKITIKANGKVEAGPPVLKVAPPKTELGEGKDV